MARKKGRGADRGSARREKTPMTLEEFFSNELPTLSDVVTFSNNLPMSLYADSTGVKSPEVVYRGLMLSRNHLLSEEYLLNFRRSEADLGVAVGVNNYSLPMAVGTIVHRDREETDEDIVPLPPYRQLRVPLGSAVRSRRSVRRYSGEAMPLDELSTLLFYGAGTTGKLEVEHAPETVSLGKSDEIQLRSAASGGGLYPVDLFVLALAVDGLEPRAYRYLPRHHGLKPVGPLSVPPLRRLAQFGEIEVEKASCLLGYVYNLFENSRKYGEAGLGFAFIEAGYIASHIHLGVTALGGGACDVGSFVKPRLEKLFEADGVSRHLIHLTVIGK